MRCCCPPDSVALRGHTPKGSAQAAATRVSTMLSEASWGGHQPFFFEAINRWPQKFTRALIKR